MIQKLDRIGQNSKKNLQGLDKEYRLILVSDDCTVANGFRTYYNMTAPSQQNDQLTVLI